jgi:hypothetical protein
VSIPLWNSNYPLSASVVTPDYGTISADSNSPVNAGPKPLTTDGTHYFGACPSNPPPANEKYCGPEVGHCPSPSYSDAGCAGLINGGTVLQALCYTAGGNVVNSYSAESPGPTVTAQTNLWVRVSGLSNPYLSALWFNESYNSVVAQLPGC